MIFNERIFHEAIKGIINEKLYMGITGNIFKDAIKEFVANIMELSRKYIWIPRCNEVIEWERRNNITKHMKQNAKYNQSQIGHLGSGEKYKRQFSHDNLNRWVGYSIETDGNWMIIIGTR